MKTKLACLLICVLFLTACGIGTGAVPALITLIEPAGLTHDTFIVVRDDIVVLDTFNAYVVCHHEPLYFTVGGMRVATVNVTVGDFVRAGDVLVTLNTEANERRLAQQETRIEEMLVRNSFANAIKEIDIRIAALELAEARRLNLSERDILQREHALDRLTLEQRHLFESQEFELLRQHRLLSEINDLFEETDLVAPFDGRVVHIGVHPHSWVTAYSPIVFIADESRLSVVYNGRVAIIREIIRFIGRIGDREYELEFIPMSNAEMLRYVIAGSTPPSTFEFINIDDFVEPGQFVSIRAVRNEVNDVLIIPVNAVNRGEMYEGHYVYILENGYRTLRPIEVGLSNASFIEVRSGLAEGDEVFVNQ